MSQIHLLSQDTINKIAAGEVIERPMAVVKELVENAMDAKATAVTIEIQDGGKALIRITDNGSGIAADDIELAFAPHATSKIQDVTDLLAVSSLGFRGEALASIASVSQLEMVTKTKEDLMGIRYCTDGGEKRVQESVGCPDGTTFLIRNLFYNTPARLKFLKTSATEAGYISGLVERLALSRPDISFRFINQKQTKITTSGNGHLKDVIYHIYGRDITANLIEVSQKEVFCTMTGYIGKPVISRGNRSMMNYFINGRYIKSPLIHRAIEQAYAPYSMQHRYPFTVLHIEVDPKWMDVNVHPQKMEIRFNKEKEIYQSIFHGLTEALKHREFIPEVTFQSKEEKERKPKAAPHVEPFETKRQEQLNGGSKSVPKSDHKMLQTISKQEHAADSEKILRAFAKESTNAVLQENLILEKSTEEHQDAIETECRQIEQKTAENTVTESRQIKRATTESQQTGNSQIVNAEVENRQPTQTSAKIPEDMVAEHAEYPKKQTITNIKQETLFDQGILSEKAQKEVKIIGQIFSTYWILQYEDKMYLVDQHAAHEKVLYERFMHELEKKEPMTQLLQPPIILSLTLAQQQTVEDNMDIFTRLGYQIENFGGREYAVNGVPAHLPSVGNQELLIEVIDSLSEEQGRRQTPEILLDKVASMSCKAAVKGNSKLPVEQMQELLKELMTLENPYHCPHGRPTMITMTKRELEKKFKRIV